jgi:tetratricopeptide (TPR) repeat protein
MSSKNFWFNQHDARSQWLLLGMLFIAWVVAGWLNNEEARPRRQADFIFPSSDVRYFTFGFNEIFSDTYWLRLIQDFDVCVNPTAPKDAPRTGLNRVHHCTMDWSYHMLDVVTTLTPRNYAPYLAGSSMLSVVLDDIDGATAIYKRGLAVFPNDWQLNFQGASHLMVEVGDFDLAAFYFNRAVQNGAPGWVAALSAKLFDKVGRTELAIANLKAQLKRAPDEKFADAIKHKLYELEAKLEDETAAQKKARQEKWNNGSKENK